jgi:hypothetical protein
MGDNRLRWEAERSAEHTYYSILSVLATYYDLTIRRFIVCETDDVVKQTTNEHKSITYDLALFHVPTYNCSPLTVHL